tara:strand:+ start:362 stop:502 length:141 start_codon:yes stop_codon:yes gene_type:complete
MALAYLSATILGTLHGQEARQLRFFERDDVGSEDNALRAKAAFVPL